MAPLILLQLPLLSCHCTLGSKCIRSPLYPGAFERAMHFYFTHFPDLFITTAMSEQQKQDINLYFFFKVL